MLLKIFYQISGELTDKRIITLFGCGGNRDKLKRPLMAEISEKLSEKTFITNDNPRFEDEDSIINDIVVGFKSKNYSIIKNREEAIRKIMQ